MHLIGLAGLLEPFLGCVVAGVAVRMVLHRQLAVGALQFLVGGLAGDAQNLVIVCFAHSCIRTHSFVCFGLEATRTSAGRKSLSRSL